MDNIYGTIVPWPGCASFGMWIGGAICLGISRLGNQQPASVVRSIAGSSIALHEAPAWELKDLDGHVVKPSEFLGKVVILDFWATWCAPCQAEIPGFIALQKQYGDRGLVVIGVSLDDHGPVARETFCGGLGNELSCGPRRGGADASFRGNGNPNYGDHQSHGEDRRAPRGFTPRETFENEIKPLL